jgi:hypothetical protein
MSWAANVKKTNPTLGRDKQAIQVFLAPFIIEQTKVSHWLDPLANTCTVLVRILLGQWNISKFLPLVY